MSRSVAVLDYGSGNIRSAYRALAAVEANPVIVDNLDSAVTLSGLIVPGVGAFAACMQGIAKVSGKQIIETMLERGKPVLGICVGMQILFEHGHEHGHHCEGLGFFPGEVHKLSADILPHIGWNTIDFPQDSQLFRGIDPVQRWYFVHSYGVDAPSSSVNKDNIRIAVCEYGQPFIAAIESEGLSATQFHPEKSGTVGLQLLANWVHAI